MVKIAKLPVIPDKRYFSIGEVSHLCNLKPHVLRYWEQEFDVIKPTKRRGSRRYYQAKDVELIRFIRHLLYEKGYTINGARQELKKESKAKTEVVTADDGVIQSLILDLELLLSDLQKV